MLRYGLANIRKFIEKEKRYVWMLVFVILINSASVISNPKVSAKKQPKQRPYQIQQKLLKNNPHLRQELLQKALKDKPHIVYLFGFLTFVFLIGLFFGTILLIKFLMQTQKGKSIIPKTTGAAQIHWDVLDVIKVVIIFMFFGTTFSIFETVILIALNLKQPDTRLDMILHTLLGDILGFLFILYFVCVKYKQKIVALGLSIKRFFINIWIGVVGYVTFLPLLFGLFLAVLWIATLLKYEPPPEPIMELFFEETRAKVLVVLTVLVSLIGPAIEEVFFRGFLYSAIKKRFGPILAMLLSATLFSFLHTSVLGFLPIMSLGILLAYLYERSGSLVPSITVHIVHNSLLTALIFLSRTLMGL